MMSIFHSNDTEIDFKINNIIQSLNFYKTIRKQQKLYN